MEISLILMTTIWLSVGAVEKFCVRDRKLLLAGVFNYENIAFAYSWKDINDVQKQTVWRFQINTHQLTEMGNSLTVEDVFPGIPLFRAGFALNLICESDDEKCKLYDKLVFVFFQTFYKVFRFTDDRFVVETKEQNIPWSLKTRGDAKQFGFGNNDFDNIYAAAFKPGVEPFVFIVSNGILYKSAVDITAPSLKWIKLSEDNVFVGILGAFVSGKSELYFNQNQSPNGLLLVYDDNGIETKRTTVWKYFGCDPNLEDNQEPNSAEPGEHKPKNTGLSPEQEKTNNRYAAIIICVVIVAIIISNMSAVVFWTIVDSLKREPNPKQPS